MNAKTSFDTIAQYVERHAAAVGYDGKRTRFTCYNRKFNLISYYKEYVGSFIASEKLEGPYGSWSVTVTYNDESNPDDYDIKFDDIDVKEFTNLID